MKTILKINSFIILLMSSFIGFIGVKAGSTGHSEFEQITFPTGNETRLLVDMSDEEKESAIKKVKWKFVGWSTYNINTRSPAYYVGKTIFSRGNKTENVIEFDYNMKVGRTITNSVSVSGDLSAKVSGKIKKITLGIDFKADGDWEKTEKTTEEEKTSFKVVIKPNRKVSLLIKGFAEVTTGGSKFFILGIPFKKGNFEFIDVVTEYYELCEEAY